MTHPTQALYEKRFEEAKALDKGEADYHALEQGKFGTDIRHAAVLKHVKGLNGSIVDLGCGTGLLLQAMAEAKVKPGHYMGVDSQPERKAPLMERLAALGIPGEFMLKGWEVPFEVLDLPRSSACLMVGVMGFWGYHTQRHVKSAFDFMTKVGRHGCITFPMIWDSQQMGDLYLRRWATTDVQDLLNLPDEQVVALEREFLIWW